jgi:hypothetical protein
MAKNRELEIEGLLPGGMTILVIWWLALLIGMIVMVTAGG